MDRAVKYIPMVSLFGIIAAIYIICTAPSPTWFGLDCDIWDFHKW